MAASHIMWDGILVLFQKRRHLFLVDLYFYRYQDDIQNGIEAVEKLQLADSVEQEVQEWQEIIFDLIRTIKVFTSGISIDCMTFIWQGRVFQGIFYIF